MKEDHGLLKNIIIGVIGSYIGAFLANLLGIQLGEIFSGWFWGNLIVAAAGAIAFTAHGDWALTSNSLRQAFPSAAPIADDVWLAFRAIGLGYRAVESLFDAMHHEHQLGADAFWTEVPPHEIRQFAAYLQARQS